MLVQTLKRLTSSAYSNPPIFYWRRVLWEAGRRIAPVLSCSKRNYPFWKNGNFRIRSSPTFLARKCGTFGAAAQSTMLMKTKRLAPRAQSATQQWKKSAVTKNFFAKYLHDFLAIFAGPVVGQFRQKCGRRSQFDSAALHSPKGHLIGELCRRTRGIHHCCHEKAFGGCANRRRRKADVGRDSRHDELGSSCLATGLSKGVVVPTIHDARPLYPRGKRLGRYRFQCRQQRPLLVAFHA